MLQDDELSTPSHTREQEVCSAARLLFEHTNTDMERFVQQIEPAILSDPKELAQKIDSFCRQSGSNIEQKNENYLRSITHFLLADWQSSELHIMSGGYKRRVSRRYNKTQCAPLQGNDDELVDILPALSEPMSPDGLDPDDLYPAQEFTLADSSCDTKRDKRKSTALASVVDPRIQRRKSIDVTAKVRRGQNVVLQNTELLKGSELTRFIRYLQKRVKFKKQFDREMVLICWLMLLLGKTYDDITELSVFDDLNELSSGLYLDRKGDGWWCFPIAYSAKPHLDDAAKGLIQTQRFVFTPCPSFLLPMIRSVYTGGLQPLFLNTEITPEIFRKRLKTYSDKATEGGRITSDKLSNFMQRYCFASGCIDPVVLDFSYRLALTQTRVSRSYACLDDDVRQNALLCLWSSVGLEIKAADPDITLPQFFEPRAWICNQSVGSTFTPSLDACKQLFSSLLHRLEVYKPSREYSYDSVIQYHNRYVLYTTYLLMFSTGYRAVYNPLPSLSLHLKTYGLLVISDKDDADFTHARLVCVPPLLSEQLNYYEKHLASLAEFIRYRSPELAQTIDHLLRQDEWMLHPTDAALWYKEIKNSRKILGPLFLFRKQYDQWLPKNIAPKYLVKDQPDELRLTGNVGRHWLKSELIKRNVEPEWIDLQMGHWMTGQAPLAYYSALSHVEVGSLLGEIIDEMLKEIGWRSLASALT